MPLSAAASPGPESTTKSESMAKKSARARSNSSASGKCKSEEKKRGRRTCHMQSKPSLIAEEMENGKTEKEKSTLASAFTSQSVREQKTRLSTKLLCKCKI